MTASNKNCGTCAVPTRKKVNKSDCAGFKDERILTVKNCSTYVQAATKFTITQALAYASSAGMPVTRPTLINWCVTYGIGKQIGHKGGKWYVDPVKLRKFLKEDA